MNVVNFTLGTPYKKIIDDALLKLKENGELQKLKDLWWKEKRAGNCGVINNVVSIKLRYDCLLIKISIKFGVNFSNKKRRQKSHWI